VSRNENCQRERESGEGKEGVRNKRADVIFDVMHWVVLIVHFGVKEGRA
jgi:hypothetical protein